MLQPHQQAFLDTALSRGVLRFGEFTLKSGRQSPYFFNMGRIDTGAALADIGTAYAAAVAADGLAFDMLFGPAYKGIPLAAATAYARPSSASAAPESNRPALKKYGLTRPDFSVNSPKRSALRWIARSRKARWLCSTGFGIRDSGFVW